MPQGRIKDKGKVFRDPVHGLIRIEPADEFVLDLIDTPEFQRLRRIRQLGVSSLTYHGAEHSRFVHSLGVFNFAQRIIAALRHRYGEEHPVSQCLAEHERVAKAAALLHDIGHGPFSHMIERAGGSTFDHETMTARLITRESSGVNRVLVEHKIDPQAVADVIDKVFPHRLIVDVVSSQLDADRMDYLLRDSLMTGVEYGVYDAEWLLNAVCVCLDPGADTGEPPERSWRLCLDRDRGLFAAEQLILARHHMMLQVYMHRVTRGYEVMVLGLMASAAALRDRLPAGTPNVVREYFQRGIELEHGDWLAFDESTMFAAFHAWSRADPAEYPHMARLSGAFLRRERLYRAYRLAGVGVPAAMALQTELLRSNLKEGLDWGLDNGVHLPYKGILHTARKGGGAEEQSTVSILLSDGDPSHKGRAVESESEVFEGLDRSPQVVTRLYVDRERVKDVEPILGKLGIKGESA
jgi:HD superfamily phosphohydrolase